MTWAQPECLGWLRWRSGRRGGSGARLRARKKCDGSKKKVLRRDNADHIFRESAGQPTQTTSNEDNMSTKTYSHMIVRKISGLVAGRFCSEAAAMKALRAKDSARDPLELRSYSAAYFAQMGR